MFRVFAAMLFFAWSGASIAQPVDGAAIFKRCVACHQPNGKGIPGSYPPLTGHLGRLASSAVGREYLIMVLSAGLVGEIKIDTQTYRGLMPAQKGLKDAEMAAVLNHVLTSWSTRTLRKGWAPFTANEVGLVRNKYKSFGASDVAAMRRKVPQAGVQ